MGHNLSKIEIDAFKAMIETTVEEFPNFKVAAMRALLETLISDGRSTPGRKQPNDVEVVRFPGK